MHSVSFVMLNRGKTKGKSSMGTLEILSSTTSIPDKNPST